MKKTRFHQSRSIGAKAESLVEKILRARFKMVEKVITPQARDGRFLRTCSGDFRAITENGRSVLVEVKYRDRPLRRSDFQDHQRESLHTHSEFGGLSLVAHVQGENCTLAEWSNVESSFPGREPLDDNRLWKAKLREVRSLQGQTPPNEFQV